MCRGRRVIAKGVAAGMPRAALLIVAIVFVTLGNASAHASPPVTTAFSGKYLAFRYPANWRVLKSVTSTKASTLYFGEMAIVGVDANNYAAVAVFRPGASLPRFLTDAQITDQIGRAALITMGMRRDIHGAKLSAATLGGRTAALIALQALRNGRLQAGRITMAEIAGHVYEVACFSNAESAGAVAQGCGAVMNSIIAMSLRRAALISTAGKPPGVLGGTLTSNEPTGPKPFLPSTPPPRPQPQTILEVPASGPAPPGVTTGSAQICYGGTFGFGGSPYEWQPTEQAGSPPADELFNHQIGVSGWAITPNLSNIDIWFNHSFGFDWEYYIAPDRPFWNLVRPPSTPRLDDQYLIAQRRAREMGLQLPSWNPPNSPVSFGLTLGVETDAGLVPGAPHTPGYPDLPPNAPASFANFAEQEGDRVADFGRWIVDCGHADFHTEIHPPALKVNARVINVPNPDNPSAPGRPTTAAFVLANPFLVLQRYSPDGGNLYGHFVSELAKAMCRVLFFIPCSLRVEGHALIADWPVQQPTAYTFLVRPPPHRPQDGNVIHVSYHFTRRQEVAVRVFRADPSTLGVEVNYNHSVANAIKPTLPPNGNCSVSVDTLASQDADVAGILSLVQILYGTIGPAVSDGLNPFSPIVGAGIPGINEAETRSYPRPRRAIRLLPATSGGEPRRRTAHGYDAGKYRSTAVARRDLS
jgi:hypothetical protein